MTLPILYNYIYYLSGNSYFMRRLMENLKFDGAHIIDINLIQPHASELHILTSGASSDTYQSNTDSDLFIDHVMFVANGMDRTEKRDYCLCFQCRSIPTNLVTTLFTSLNREVYH